MSNQETKPEERNALPVLPKAAPIHEYVSGRVRGSIWKNFSKTAGTYYKVSIRRVEFDESGSVYLANSFWPEDLHDLAAVATSCRIFLHDATDAFKERARVPKPLLHEAYRPAPKSRKKKAE